MQFAKNVFRLAGVYGILALLPQYFLEQRIGRDYPPPITHPEHFYGFIGVALAWQFAFLVMATDPQRFRPLMPVAILEKVSFGAAALALFAYARIPATVLFFGCVDLLLAALFALAFLKTRSPEVTA